MSSPADFYRPLRLTDMNWEQYAKELEKIIEAITMPEYTRITVDALVKDAKDKAEGWTAMQEGKPA